MHVLKIACALIISSFLILSCSTPNRIQKKPPERLYGLTLSKGIEKQSTMAVPLNPTTDFSSQDQEVYALMKFENLSGKYRLKWDWFNPNGDLYHSTGDFPLTVSNGKYLKQATAWHSLVLNGDDAVNYPGMWEIKVFVNGEQVESQFFSLASVTSMVDLPAGSAPKPFPEDWGLIIGIQDYAHLPTVNFAKKDALIMRDYFMRILRVPEENIIMLTGSDATKARMQGYLEKYIPSNVVSDSTLYVYFAGHGAPGIDTGDPYLIPYDGDTRFIEQTGYKLKKLYQDLKKMGIRQTYVFLDSCFSGAASRAAEMLTEGTRPALLNVKNVELLDDSIVALSATSKGQTSIAYPETGHGLFTYYLLRALKGEADADDDQWISIKEVYDYVSRHVSRVARRLGSDQDPSITPSTGKLKDMAIGRVVR